MKVLLTGGAGFIGSHTYVALDNAGYVPVILDNFSNSNRGVLKRLHALTGKPVILEEGDVCNHEFVKTVLEKHAIKSVIHFAAWKAVGQSVANPLTYYRNNIDGLLSILEGMQATSCNHLVFSGSATVYGNPEILPLTERARLQHVNPYGHTKLIGEEILGYVQKANPNLMVAVLRYFNPVGAHESGTIGEDPNGVPNNLMPYICQVATGRLPKLKILGNDYPTPDGTGVRDYIHVVDLAEGHVVALKKLLDKKEGFTVNLGTGRGHSVLEVVKAFEKASGKAIPFEMAPRRPGDAASCYADVSLAETILGWKASRDIDAMCTDSWRWQSANPNGFKT